jgi:hypothetical protein
MREEMDRLMPTFEKRGLSFRWRWLFMGAANEVAKARGYWDMGQMTRNDWEVAANAAHALTARYLAGENWYILCAEVRP